MSCRQYVEKEETEKKKNRDEKHDPNFYQTTSFIKKHFL